MIARNVNAAENATHAERPFASFISFIDHAAVKIKNMLDKMRNTKCILCVNIFYCFLNNSVVKYLTNVLINNELQANKSQYLLCFSHLNLGIIKLFAIAAINEGKSRGIQMIKDANNFNELFDKRITNLY